jgi:hypothetical protein
VDQLESLYLYGSTMSSTCFSEMDDLRRMENVFDGYWHILVAANLNQAYTSGRRLSSTSSVGDHSRMGRTTYLSPAEKLIVNSIPDITRTTILFALESYLTIGL